VDARHDFVLVHVKTSTSSIEFLHRHLPMWRSRPETLVDELYPTCCNSRARSCDQLDLVTTIQGARRASGQTQLRACSHQGQNRPPCRPRRTHLIRFAHQGVHPIMATQFDWIHRGYTGGSAATARERSTL
jgi:hypothetical protein